MSFKFPLLLAAPAVALLLASPPAAAQATGAAASDNNDAQIRELREQVKKLEARLAELEKQVKPLVAQRGGGGAAAGGGDNDAKPAAAVQPATRNEALVRQAQVKARARMRQDARKHSSEEIGSAEELYQVANKNWRTEQARQSLQQMVEKFPDVNRTGCAVLYLGQMSVGEERERLLTDAMEKYGDCYYGNGVNVGAYARFLLAHYYKDNGEADKAKKLFNEIRTKYADAVDHGGRSLLAQVQAAEAGNAE